MNDDTALNARPTVAPVDLPDKVKKSKRTTSPLIISENRRGTETMGAVLARVYRIVLAGSEGSYEPTR
jgi:hypothetical protein